MINLRKQTIRIIWVNDLIKGHRWRKAKKHNQWNRLFSDRQNTQRKDKASIVNSYFRYSISELV